MRHLLPLFTPGIVLATAFLSVLPRPIRYGLLALVRGMPGLPGLGIRYLCVRSLARSCGENVYVGPYVMLSYLENCDIGSNVSFREFCNVGCLGGASIGNNVSLASGTVLLTTEHDHTQLDTPMRSAPIIKRPTTVEDGVWVGANVVITAGVTIGRESVIGSGAVVTKPIPPYSIAVGVPAKVIGSRQGAKQDSDTL